MQATVDQGARLPGLAAPQAGHDQHVFPQFSLSVAAADADHIGHQRLEDADRRAVVAGRHGARALAHRNCDFARR